MAEQGMKIGILASGRGSNMEALINACQNGSLPAQVVVVLSDKPSAGALSTARDKGVAVHYLDSREYDSREAFDRTLVAKLQEYGVELVCLAGYMKLVTREFIEPYAGRILNVHPSLLPAFPGLNAQAQALAFGAKVAGCSVHLVELEMDSGPIVMQAAVPVEEGDTEASLSARILEQEHRIYVESVRRFARGQVQVDGRQVRFSG